MGGGAGAGGIVAAANGKKISHWAKTDLPVTVRKWLGLDLPKATASVPGSDPNDKIAPQPRVKVKPFIDPKAPKAVTDEDFSKP